MAATYKILGIDLCPDHLSVVQIHRQPQGPVMTHAAFTRLPANQTPLQIADSLKETIAKNGFTTNQAVISLPFNKGFVQSSPPDLKSQRQVLPQQDHMVDSWMASDGTIVRATAGREDVSRCQEIAALAGLQLLGIDLHSTAALTTAGFWSPDSAAQVALVFSQHTITLGLMQGQTLRSAQTNIRHDTGGDWKRDLTAAQSMLRLMQLSQIRIPARTPCLVVNCPHEELASALQEQTDLEIRSIHPGEPAGLKIACDGVESLAPYVTAIGLALSGLKIASQPKTMSASSTGPRPFNFLKLSGEKEGGFSLNWRQALTAACVVLAALLIVTAGYALRKHNERSQLQAEYNRLAPLIAEYEQALHLRIGVRQWVPLLEEGKRPTSRPIIDAITELFPSTDQTYVSWVEIRLDDQGQMLVRLEGRSRNSEVLYEFVSRLNNSRMFAKATLGQVVDIPDTTSPYVKKFTVTFALRKQENV